MFFAAMFTQACESKGCDFLHWYHFHAEYPCVEYPCGKCVKCTLFIIDISVLQLNNKIISFRKQQSNAFIILWNKGAFQYLLGIFVYIFIPHFSYPTFLIR